MSSLSFQDLVAPAHDDVQLRAEWDALTQDAGAVRLSDFRLLKVEGPDRVSWLHSLITANVETMTDGAGAYALLLEAKGHVLADFVLLRQADSFLLYTSRAAHDQLVFNLRRAIFREKVTLTDLSDQYSIISLQGPKSLAVANKAFVSNLSISRFDFLPFIYANHQLLLVHHPRASAGGFDLVSPSDAAPTIWGALLANGAQPAGIDALNIARVEAAIPLYGADFDVSTLAPEARLDAFIAENKGCYPGQEVIARIRNLGHVNRLLCQFQIDGDTIPSSGDRVFVEGIEAGVITSSVWSYARNAPIALGYIRKEWEMGGIGLQIVHGKERLNATVVQQPT